MEVLSCPAIEKVSLHTIVGILCQYGYFKRFNCHAFISLDDQLLPRSRRQQKGEKLLLTLPMFFLEAAHYHCGLL